MSVDESGSAEFSSGRGSRLLLVLALLLHLLPFATRPALIGGDEPHYALAAHSLATDGDLRLEDDYEAVAEGAAAAGRKRAGQELERHLLRTGPRTLFSHPVGLPLLAAPLLALQQAVAPGASPDLPLALFTLALTFGALVVLWRLVRRRAGERRAALLVFGVYFSSPLWYYSRTFFTEPYTWAFAALGAAALVHRRGGLAALCLALAPAMKETALLLVVPILIASLRLRGLRTTAIASLGPTVFGLLYCAKNQVLTGRPLTTFQPYQLGEPLAGAAGLLFDPAHGLVWFAPLLAVAAVGWLVPGGDDARRWVLGCSLLAFAGYFLVTAGWIDWRGGASYATRLLLPALPALTVPLVRLHQVLSRTWRRPLLLAAGSVGFAVNLCAAVDPVPAMWEASAPALVAGRPVVFLIGLVVAACAGWRLWRPPPVDCLRPE